MRKQKVLLISVLKPVDDPRMFEKFAVSIAANPNYEVHVAGNKGSGNSHSDVQQHPTKELTRISLLRIFSFISVLKVIFKVRPDLIITSTHESLVVIVIYKLLYGCKLCYDMQENYYLNLIHSPHHTYAVKHIIATFVRLKEIITYPFIDHYFLAEKCYRNEMPWLEKKSTVLENKALLYETKREHQNNTTNELHLIYTGIIGENYGTLEAVALAKALLKLRGGSFLIAGFSPDKKYLKRLYKFIGNDRRITITGGDKFVNHKDILQHASRASLGIVSYQNNPAINDKIPTRIYEYLSLHLPFIIPQNEVWNSYCKPFNACISTSFTHPKPKDILEWYDKNDFYNVTPGPEISWTEEEVKLQSCIDNILIIN